MSEPKVTDELAEEQCIQRVKDHKPFHCPNGHPQVYADQTPTRLAELEKALATMQKRDDQLTAWVKRAPHLDTCDTRVGRACDCGRKDLVGDADAPVTTARN